MSVHALSADATDPFGDDLPLVLRSLLLPAAAAALGGAATARTVKSWYPTLEKPSWNPPASVFGPVWTVLYTTMGVADFIVAARGGDSARFARRIYFIQLGLNTLWSVLFFGLKAPGFALVDIIGLWIAIVATIAAFWKISKPAALLLMPYLAWTTFATALNAAIWSKNRGR